MPDEKPPSKQKNPRGLFERPPGSGVWWINYYERGKQRREKVGRKSDAIKLYQARKADVTVGRKLPELRATKAVLFQDLIEEALEFTSSHKDARSYVTKAKIVGDDFGGLEAAEIKPQQIEAWLRRRKRSNATWNRYRAFFSLCFRRGMKHGKVPTNPATQVDRKGESTGRARYLTMDEYKRLHAVIVEDFPEHLAEFIVSVKTGMRLSEQYTVEWSQVHLDRRTIELTKTKNGSARTVHLNSDAVAAIRSVQTPASRGKAPLFPRQGATFDTRSWFHPCLTKADVTKYTWHCNRHTFCSWLAMAGASALDIMTAAGHKTMAMAARYSHLSPEHNSSVVDRISSQSLAQHAPAHAPEATVSV